MVGRLRNLFLVFFTVDDIYILKEETLKGAKIKTVDEWNSIMVFTIFHENHD